MVKEPEEVYNIKDHSARLEFINCFKEVQRIKTQLDQYTDLNEEQKAKIEQLLPEEELRSFRVSYLDIAKQLKDIQQKEGSNAPPVIQQLEFEFVLFASALIDYDYTMNLIAKYTQGAPKKQKMTRDQLIGVLSSSANLMDGRDDIIGYIDTLQVGKALNENEIRNGYIHFKAEKTGKELSTIAQKNGLEISALKQFSEIVLSRMIFDGEKLSELFTPLDLGWKERSKREEALMKDLSPLLKKLAS